jgi:hypothetical protein
LVCVPKFSVCQTEKSKRHMSNTSMIREISEFNMRDKKQWIDHFSRFSLTRLRCIENAKR